MIEIQGMSAKQMALADIMWAISSKEGVMRSLLPCPVQSDSSVNWSSK